MASYRLFFSVLYVKALPNEYVAFEDGQVLDHDVDEQQLANRVYAKYGYRDLLIKQVTVEEPIF